MKPGTVLASQLIDALEAASISWRSYSGRGMYGACCVAALTNDAQSSNDIREAAKDVPGAPDNECMDQLGRGVVLYWPGARLVYDSAAIKEQK